ncbi:S-layer homology domain-containing protein [Oscillibacter valericigenes]|uniref:S-layer homology domain-containing protein n=1 Tax=Oscillibacter valericigenes TaxID=351091 RepID=UPI001F442EC4|nr:S-layer homology domain-containing protein [Oscillibacter valericigenes]MCF2663967.1 S-layer homology domain-containing protein [Oscillibacter valericigenes]
MDLRRLLGALLALVLCFGMLPVGADAASFSDVPKGHWAYDAIMAAETRGLIQGSGGKFRPGDSVSSQAFLSMVCRAWGMDDRKLETGDRWAEPAMAFGQYAGWFEEEELTRTSRTKPITREFAAKLLVNALFPEELEQRGAAIRFQDQNEIGWARRPYVQAAARLGLITGYEDGTFRPQSPLTRAAAASLLNRALQIKESNEPGESVQVPILMYHDISYLGSGYSKTPEVFRRQMQELKDAGFHTVTYTQLIDFVENGTPLPEKPIVISVDDGYRSNYEYLYPILQELDMKAEIALIGGAIQYSSWGLKWDEVREMADSGLVSFQAHTDQMHNDQTSEGGRLGVLKAPKESWTEYVELLGTDTNTILNKIERKTGTRPVAFVYPRGKWNTMAEAVIRSAGCKVSVTTKDGVAKITQGVPDSLHLMDRIGMDFRNGSVVSVLMQFGYQGGA